MPSRILPTREVRLAMLLPMVLATGCAQYRWQMDYESAERQARTQDKHLFIFYKYWLDSDSGRMLSSEGLSDPEVTRLLQGMVHVLLDYDYGPSYRNYVARYGVTSYPAVILVVPDGQYAMRTGYLSREQLVEFIQSVTAAHPPRPLPGEAVKPPARQP